MTNTDEDVQQLYEKITALEKKIVEFSKKVNKNERDIGIIVNFCKSLSPLINVIKKLKLL